MEKENIKVSIIVPCYKRALQTQRTIGLIFASTGWGTSFQGEVIVADSTHDDSLKKMVLKKFTEQSKCGEFFYIKPKKNGVAVNKNAGAKKAKYPILIFCDSDIEIEKDTLLKTIKALRAYPKAAGLTGNVIWRGGKNQGKYDRPKKEDRFIKKYNHVFLEMIYSRYFATYKNVFNKVGGYDEQIFNMRGEGSDLSMRYWRGGFPLCFEKTIKVYHREDAPNSIALRVKNPHYKVAKDMWLLGLKYKNFENLSENLAKTITMNFAQCKNPIFEFLEGLYQHKNFIKQNNNPVEKKKAKYHFQYIETFSKKNASLLGKCLQQAGPYNI